MLPLIRLLEPTCAESGLCFFWILGLEFFNSNTVLPKAENVLSLFLDFDLDLDLDLSFIFGLKLFVHCLTFCARSGVLDDVQIKLFWKFWLLATIWCLDPLSETILFVEGLSF